jgi:hypothetical protein
MAGAAKYRKNHPEKRRAKNLIQYLTKAGKLTRANACSHCGKTDVPIDAHHPDYSRPAEVVWLCRRCHARANLKLIDVSL